MAGEAPRISHEIENGNGTLNANYAQRHLEPLQYLGRLNTILDDTSREIQVRGLARLMFTQATPVVRKEYERLSGRHIESLINDIEQASVAPQNTYDRVDAAREEFLTLNPTYARVWVDNPPAFIDKNAA